MSTPSATTRPQVVLSLGMGVDSAAILTRWLLQPDSRDFALNDLLVLTAMTGNEYPRTGELMERHLLPLMRRHQVRYAQVARAGASQSDGIVVLSDSRSTQAMFLDGVHTLGKELTDAGTVPQVASGKRLCSVKFKGWVLDSFLEAELHGRSFRHVMGFAAEEQDRATRDATFARGGRLSEYPLIEWDWDRAACEQYLQEVFGEPWARSCCIWCPFQASSGSRDAMLGRWEAAPQAAYEALRVELLSLTLNPRGTLLGTRSAAGLVADDGGPAARAAQQQLHADLRHHLPHALYEVRRIAAGAAGPGMRSVRVLEVGSRAQMLAALEGRAQAAGRQVEQDQGVNRLWLRRRTSAQPDAPEHFYAVGPQGAKDKQRVAFEQRWALACRDAAQPRLAA